MLQMKDYYKISEISKLYGIGADSLRYYEKIGVLNPKRDDNGYRLYSIKDIYKFNVIRDLRQLDFSMKQIKDYLDYQSVSNTLELLQEEQELIQKRLEALSAAKLSIRSRMDYLTNISKIKADEFTIKVFPERQCLQLNTEITRDEETDFAIKKLHRKYENIIQELGDQSVGAIPSMEAFHKGIYGIFNSVFFILEEKINEYDFILPAGRYLSLYYRGEYTQTPDKLHAVLNYANSNNLKLAGDPFELYHIDNRYTIKPEEYLTEIQIYIADEA